MTDTRSSQMARAVSLVELRRWDDAIASLGHLVASDPSDPRSRCLLAQALLGAGRADEALEQAGAAAAADPDGEWPHRLRSIALRTLGQHQAAVAAAREAVRLAPGVASPYLALVDAELAAGNTRAAGAAAAKAAELAPHQPSAHNALGRVALARHRNRKAEGHFRDALRLDPESPAVLNNMGVVALRQGRRRAAVAYFASASRANPQDGLPRRNAVRAAAGIGAFGVVVIAAQVARSLTTTSGSPDALLAWVAMSIGVAVAIGGLILRDRLRSRRHPEPVANKELMRSLRRQATLAERFLPQRRAVGARLANRTLWISASLGGLMVFGAVGILRRSHPGGTMAVVGYWVVLAVAAFVAVAALVALAVRRRRRSAVA